MSTFFEEMKEQDENKSKEAERDEAKKLQRSGSSRRTKKEADSQDFLSFESCRSSAVDHVEEMSLDSPREMQDEQEVMNETSGSATRGRREDAWRLEPEGETETPETIVFFGTGWKASPDTLMVKVTMSRCK